MNCSFEHDAVVYKVEALRSDAVDGLFKFHIKEADTGKIVAEIKRSLEEAEKGEHDGGLLFTFPAPVHLRAGVGYKTSGNCIYLLMEGGLVDKDAPQSGVKIESVPNVPY